MEMKQLNGITAIIPMEGTISAEIEDVLKAEYKEAEREGIQNIILDFRPLDHIHIDGLSAFVKLSLIASRLNVTTCTYNLSGRYREIFQMTGISPYYPEYEHVRKNIIMLSEPENRILEKQNNGNRGNQDDFGWSPMIEHIELGEKPAGALLKNMKNRKVVGPLQGFGALWQKTYSLIVTRPDTGPVEVMAALKQHFPEFQPKYNRFYPTSKGIQPGENVFIDSSTPGGIVSTGVTVLYADDTSFSLITPEGHPEAGWVTFSASQKEEAVLVKIQGLASASDPVYELAFRMIGAKFQENIWKHVLGKLAKHLDTEDNVKMNKVIIDKSLHWNRSVNIRKNAQLRSLPLNISRLFGNNKA
ncbi:MAG: STAS domain-containing protein [Dehalococcoidales bacterium]|nr:STAS domain-containing protein [Dehalococcoidales bacterium]